MTSDYPLNTLAVGSPLLIYHSAPEMFSPDPIRFSLPLTTVPIVKYLAAFSLIGRDVRIEYTKKSRADSGQSASELISQRIGELGDWRGATLSRMRKLIKEADPAVVEE